MTPNLPSDHSNSALSHWERVGPTLRYTNDRAHEMERSVAGFARLVNDDLYDLLKWAASLNDEIDRLRRWIDTEGRNCPSNSTVDAVLGLVETDETELAPKEGNDA